MAPPRHEPGSRLPPLLLLGGLLLVSACEPADGWPWRRNMFDSPGPQAQEAVVAPPEGVLPAAVEDGHADLLGDQRTGRAGQGTGKALYDRYCAVCHGATATGKDLGEDYFAPDLTEVDYLERLDEDIYAVIVDGGLSMPSYADALTEPETRMVIDHLRTLQRADD